MSKPIRVLHVLGNLNFEGAQTLVMNVYRNLNREVIQFDFIIHTEDMSGYAEEIVKLGGRIYSIERYRLINTNAYCKYWKQFFLDHGEYKVIHGHVRSTASMYLKIAKKFGIATISHSHSTSSRGNILERWVKSFLQKNIIRYSDYLLACSKDAGEWLYGEFIYKTSNFEIIKNGIEFDKYIYNVSERDSVRKELGIINEEVIGHVGSFTEPKNHRFLIKVFKEYHDRNDKSVLILVGDGNLRNPIVKLIEDYQLQKNVMLLGARNDVNRILQAFDIFVFPSKFEGLGIALIEAQANGLPCVISDTIPKEAEINDNIKRLSVKESLEKWIEAISCASNFGRKQLTNQEINDSGYDIKITMEKLIKIYNS